MIQTSTLEKTGHYGSRPGSTSLKKRLATMGQDLVQPAGSCASQARQPVLLGVFALDLPFHCMIVMLNETCVRSDCVHNKTKTNT